MRDTANLISIPNKHARSFVNFDASTAKVLCGTDAPKPYQGECFNTLADEDRRIIDIPTAAGKSLIIMALAAHDAQNGYKPIIAVPQLSIGLGFEEDHFILPTTGEEVLWDTYKKNFLIDNTSESNITRVIEFIRTRPSRDAGAAQLITTHQTLALVFEKLYETGETRLLKRVSLFIDECHHVIGDELTSNSVGRLVRNVAKKISTRLSLITATNFRTDGLQIAPNDISTFAKYGLPYDEYIKHKSIGALGFQYRLFTEKPGKEAGTLARDNLCKGERSIIYIPFTRHSFYSVYGYPSDHHEMKKQIVGEILYGISSRAKWKMDEAGHLWTARLNGKTIRVVDLIDNESDRKYKMNYINETKSCVENGADVIIAMNMFKEGSDYPLLQHAIVIEPRNSINQVIQMFGRVMRDDVKVNERCKFAKKRVGFTYLLSAPHESYEQFSVYMNALIQAMLLVEVMEPVLVSKEVNTPVDEPIEGTYKVRGIVPALSEIFGDLSTAQKVQHGIIEKISSDGDWGEISGIERKERMVELVNEHLLKNNISLSDNISTTDVANKLYAVLVRGIIPARVLAEIIDPDLIYKYKPLTYISKVMGRSFFQEFRTALIERYNTNEEYAKQQTRSVAEYKHKNGKYPPGSGKNLSPLGSWLSRMRSVLAGTVTTSTWYPSCEDLATRLGCSDMFDAKAREQEALYRTRECIEHLHEHGRYPAAKTGEFIQLGLWFTRMRGARNGNVNTRWYPSCEKLASDLGCPEMFTSDVYNKEMVALEKTREVAVYKKKHNIYPTGYGDATALAHWLGRMRGITRGGTNGTRYKSCEKLAIELGCPDMFEAPSSYEAREKIALERTREVVAHKKKHGVYPHNSTLLGVWLSGLRWAKSRLTSHRTHGTVWYEACETLAIKLGDPDMFESPQSPNKREKSALERTREAATYKKEHGVYPTNGLKGGSLGNWLTSMRCAKKGTNARVWFPSCEELSTELGCPDMFDSKEPVGGRKRK